MDMKTSERLYALLIKLRPLERGTLMPFAGELIHAAWLDWIRNDAPEVATMLHDGNRRRLFTCSNLHFPFPSQRLRDAERQNVHLPIEPEKVYTIRLTLLLGELFPLFYHSLMSYSVKESGERPFLRLGKRIFLLEEVVASPDDASCWTGYTSFAKLVEKVRTLRLKPEEFLTLEFASPTTFHRGNDRSPYGKYYALFPLPRYVFPWLANRWRELAPPELAELVQRDRIERYIDDEGLIIDDHALSTHCVHFIRYPQRGFLGTCTYCLRGPDEEHVMPGQLTVRQQILLLTWLAFYTGAGYKTPMGMGQVRLK